MAASNDEMARMSDLTGPINRFSNWLSNFTTYLNANIAGPAALAAGGAGAAGPPATGAILWNGLSALWVAAVALATNPVSRTSATILAAKVLRFNPGKIDNPFGAVLGPGVPGSAGGLVGALRVLIRKIQGAGTASADQLKALGLTPHTKQRSVPIIPHAGPEITLDRSAPHVMTVKYHQEGMREDSRAKPLGCKGCLLKWATNNGASGSEVFTKSPCYMDVGVALSGQLIRIQGFWVMGNNKISGGGNVVQAGVP